MSKLFVYEEDAWTGMDQITSHIWLGDSGAARDYNTLKKEGITATLNVAIDLDTSDYYGPDVLRCKRGLIDGPGNEQADFDKAVQLLIELLAEGHKVLVHCHAGVSRSPSVVAAHIAKTTGNSFQYALDFVGEKRPIIHPHAALVKLARTFLKEIP